MNSEALKIIPQDPVALAEQDGPWIDAKEIAGDLFGGKVGERWVRINVPGKVRFGHSKCLWRRNRVLRWMADRERLAG